MLPQSIKYCSIFFCCIYVYFKLMNYSVLKKQEKTYLAISLIILTGLSLVMEMYSLKFTYILPLFLLWCILSLLTCRAQESFITIIISFVLSFTLHAIPSFLLTFVFYPIYGDYKNYPYVLLAILSSIAQIHLCIHLFKIKRFKKGMPFLLSTDILNIATVLSLTIIIFLAYSTFGIFEDKLQVMFFISLFFALAFIIFWWQAQLIKAYKRRILLREIESLRTELEEKEEQIAVLSKQNEDLGRLIHKDNKLIPSMVHSVKTYLATDFSDASAAIERGNALLIELHEVSRHRSNVITEIHGPKHKPYATGCMAVDTMLNFMRDKLCDKHVDFSVHFGVDLKHYVPSSISDMDLGHLLSDLIDNAYNATSNCDNPIIVIQFYEAENSLVLEIADNGVPFEANSLLNFGLEAITTHSDTGGHGFGLLDIWRHKTNYRATLHIDEYEDDAPYSKKISLIFNKKNKYTIRTWRKDELERLSQRTDLQVYDTTV